MSTTVVFIDLETGGVDVERSPIIQIAAIAIGGSDGEFECKLQFDEATADPKALELNSFDAAVWAEKAVSPREAMSRLSAFLKSHATVEMVSQRTGNPYRVAQLAGHNAAAFDGPMLQRWYRQAGEFFPASYHVLDTLQLALWHFHGRPLNRPENLKLTTLAKYFGIETDDAHDSLADVKLAHRVAVALRSAGK